MEDAPTTEDALARERVARLLENWDWPDPAILENIVALGEAAIPAIADALTPELLADTHVDDQAATTAFYLAEVLGMTGSPRAIPLLVEMFRRVDDDTIEDLPYILQPLGPAAINGLLSVVADNSLGWYARAMASNGAVSLAGDDPDLRAHVAAGLRGVLTYYLARPEPPSDEERDTIGSIIADLANLADPEARPLIDAAFAADIVLHPITPDTPWYAAIPTIDEEGVEQTYREGGRNHPMTARPFMERYREDYEEQQQKEREKRQAERLFAPLEEASPTVVLSARIGRNDPCWCGSGKKYKKCHLDQDAKERREGGKSL